VTRQAVFSWWDPGVTAQSPPFYSMKPADSSKDGPRRPLIA
jgi:hypothetical protein